MLRGRVGINEQSKTQRCKLEGLRGGSINFPIEFSLTPLVPNSFREGKQELDNAGEIVGRTTNLILSSINR
jgi:hypothetical protein